MISEKLKLAIVQTDIFWEDIAKNLKYLSLKIESLEGDVQFVVLPEMFATGFTMNVDKVKQTHEGSIVSWMKSIAIKKQLAILGSVIIEEEGLLFNRAYFFYPNGEYQYYNKKHLFTLSGEHKIFSPGKERLTVDYLGWKIMPLVCYDLRFPVWSRNDLDYDLLIYIASWPSKRRVAWQNLLKARAIENMTYLVGVNRVGIDGNRYNYSGDSVVIDALGDTKSEIPEKTEKIEIVELFKTHLDNSRKSLNFLNDMDGFDVF